LSFPLFGQAGAATRNLAHRYGVGTMAITRLLRGRSVSRFVTRASRTCGNRTPRYRLGDLRDVIRAADTAVKAAIYGQLGLKVTYLTGQDKLRADVTISPEKF
jgi:hypothetical protein